MYYHEAMAEAIKKTDTDDLYNNIACKLEILCGLSDIIGRNFDRTEPGRLDIWFRFFSLPSHLSITLLEKPFFTAFAQSTQKDRLPGLPAGRILPICSSIGILK